MPAGLLESNASTEIEAIRPARRTINRSRHTHEEARYASLKEIVNHFFEASTRTRTSFEIAAKRLGAYRHLPSSRGFQHLQGRNRCGYAHTLEAKRPNATSCATQLRGRHTFSVFTAIVHRQFRLGTHEHPRRRCSTPAPSCTHLALSLDGLRVVSSAISPTSRVARSNFYQPYEFRRVEVLCGPAPSSARVRLAGARRHLDCRYPRGHPRSRRGHDAARALERQHDSAFPASNTSASTARLDHLDPGQARAI